MKDIIDIALFHEVFHVHKVVTPKITIEQGFFSLDEQEPGYFTKQGLPNPCARFYVKYQLDLEIFF